MSMMARQNEAADDGDRDGLERASRFQCPPLLSSALAMLLASVLALALATAASADHFVQQGEMLTAPETEGRYGPAFGASVVLAANGDSALVGAPLDDGFAGTAWAFNRSGAGWSEVGAPLTVPPWQYAEENGWYPEFGRFMDLSGDGDTALIGGDYLGGGVWVFNRVGSTWGEQEKLVECGEGVGERCEQASLSADGNTAIIPTFPAAGRGGAGAVRVFVRTGSTWSEQAKIAVSATGEDAHVLSAALSGDGDTALIGVPRDDGGAGSVRVLVRSGSTWTQQGDQLTGSGEIGAGAFGASVALSADGNTALVGAPADSSGAGAAWVFTRWGPKWTQSQELAGGGESNGIYGGAFGSSLALSSGGNVALIGGPDDDEGVGAAWVFSRAGESWAQEGEKLTGAGEVGEGLFGESVALSGGGDTALVGGAGFGEAGAVWTFVSQGPPDFGRCVRATAEREGRKTVYRGGFTTSTCLVASPTGTGRYEWEPGIRHAAFKTALKGRAVTLETVAGIKVTCTNEAGAGEYDGAKDVANVVLRFTGCESEHHDCATPGLPEGVLESETLEGSLGWESELEERVALDLYPVGDTGPFLEYRCVGGAPITVTGSVIVPVEAGEMRAMSTLRLEAEKGLQRPEQLQGGARDVLTASLDEEVLEPMGITGALAVLDEEAMEINPSV